jgi:acetyl esterase
MPSIREFAEDHYLTLEASCWFWHQYAPDRAADSDPNACPLLAPAEQLRAMPPALIITAECDILRDEGEAYARKLSQAGVPVTCTRYLGAIHGFMGINALADTPANRAAQEQVFAAVRKSLFSRAC